jgi:hypothetical protein
VCSRYSLGMYDSNALCFCLCWRGWWTPQTLILLSYHAGYIQNATLAISHITSWLKVKNQHVWFQMIAIDIGLSQNSNLMRNTFPWFTISNYGTLFENIWQQMRYGSSQWNSDFSVMRSHDWSTAGFKWNLRFIAIMSSYDVIWQILSVAFLLIHTNFL